MNNRYAVIMAGGVGSRFWPVSKQSFPKQFHDMLGTGRSLLQMTYDRLINTVPAGNILILTNVDYVHLVKEQLPNIKTDNIIAEPAMRNTAPCILLAALKIKKWNTNATMIVAPSDHYIPDANLFDTDLAVAFNYCDTNKSALMTLGIKPTSPNTGYGYIEYENSTDQVNEVIQFREKPEAKTAQQFIDAGNFLWNAGIFIWHVDAVLNSFAIRQPDMLALFSQATNLYNTPDEKAWLGENYALAENISIDFAIMEKAHQVKVIPATFQWNDLGTWGSLYNQLDKDSSNNAIVRAQSEVTNSHDNIINTTAGKKVILKGLNDFIIVETDDVLMIVPKTAEQEIKEIRNIAIEKFGKEIG